MKDICNNVSGCIVSDITKRFLSFKIEFDYSNTIYITANIEYNPHTILPKIITYNLNVDLNKGYVNAYSNLSEQQLLKTDFGISDEVKTKIKDVVEYVNSEYNINKENRINE